jgi:hypothetical protein
LISSLFRNKGTSLQVEKSARFNGMTQDQYICGLLIQEEQSARFNGHPEGQIDQPFDGWGQGQQKIISPFQRALSR